MKKLFALIVALVMALGLAAAVAEEEEGLQTYTELVPESKVYDSVWSTEDGDWRVEVYGEDGGFKLMVVHRLENANRDCWEYPALYDAATKSLICNPFGLHYTDIDGEWTMHYEDGDGSFTIREDGKLVWEDKKEDAGKGLEFQKIGNFYGTQWKKDNVTVEFYDWYDGEYDIRVFKYDEKGEIIDNAILKGDYDPETNTVTAMGAFDDGENITVTFGYTENNDLTWTQDGETTVYTYLMESDAQG